MPSPGRPGSSSSAVLAQAMPATDSRRLRAAPSRSPSRPASRPAADPGDAGKVYWQAYADFGKALGID